MKPKITVIKPIAYRDRQGVQFALLSISGLPPKSCEFIVADKSGGPIERAAINLTDEQYANWPIGPDGDYLENCVLENLGLTRDVAGQEDYDAKVQADMEARAALDARRNEAIARVLEAQQRALIPSN